MVDAFEIDHNPGKPVGNKTMVPNNWNSGLLGPFGNKTGQPLLPWRYKIDLSVSQQAKDSFAAYKLQGRCPIDILEKFIQKDSLKKGYGRWQSLEVLPVANGKELKWNIGNLTRNLIAYEMPSLQLNLHAVETTSLFVKKFALLLIDCAMERTTGYYFPFACRFPLDIRLTTYGFKDGYTRTIRYQQCGIVNDQVYEMGYKINEIVNNKLSFICTRPEFANITEYYEDQWLDED